LCTAGFNAPVAGTFFAIETVLRPQHAENSPPLTTAMIILAAVTSSTVSQVLLDEKAAFTVPPYELRSAAGVSSLYHLQDLLFSVGSSCPEYTE
jgi:H+/Cl- antiporter ClcA